LNFRLSRYFSISSLVGVVVVIAVLSLFYRYTAVNTLIEHETRSNTSLAKVFANVIWSKYSSFIEESSHLSRQELISRPEITWLHRDMLTQISGLNIVKVKIYYLNGVTLYSTDPQLIGESAGNNPNFQAAKSGVPVSDLVFRHQYSADENVRVDRDLLSTYVPLHSLSDNKVGAVLELYSDVTELVNNIKHTQENVIGGVFSVLMLLYLFLQLIVKRADKLIQSHEKARAANLEKIHYLAFHDPMTRLPNKEQFSRSIREAMELTKHDRKMMALMFVDVDRFKLINDSLGHDAGDELLRIIARRLQYPIRKCDQLFRWGGDEFTLLLQDISDISMVENMARRIIRSMAKPINLKAHEVQVTTSIGIAVFSHEDTLSCEQILNNADAAMYQAKRAGRNCYEFYDARINEALKEKLSVEVALKKAINDSEFRLYYQPRVSVFSGKVTAVEALLRWVHPQLGLIEPDKFIPILEENGLIKTVGDWVLNTACMQLKKWKSQGMPSVRVSLNVSAAQLSNGDFVEQVKNAIEAAQIDAHSLELEFTESIFSENRENTLRIMERLKALGVALSIDDFGSGNWSLTYLKKMPVDYIKIGRSFIQGVLTNRKDAAITRAIARLAHSMNMRLVAEGVESAEQVEVLKKSGCHELQGYYLTRPVMALEIPLIVAARSKPDIRKIAITQ